MEWHKNKTHATAKWRRDERAKRKKLEPKCSNDKHWWRIFCVSFEISRKKSDKMCIILYTNDFAALTIYHLPFTTTHHHSHRMHFIICIIQVSFYIPHTAYIYVCIVAVPLSCLVFILWSIPNKWTKRTWECLNDLFYRMWWANCVFFFSHFYIMFKLQIQKLLFCSYWKLEWLIPDCIRFSSVSKWFKFLFFFFRLFQDQTHNNSIPSILMQEIKIPQTKLKFSVNKTSYSKVAINDKEPKTLNENVNM